MTRKIFIDTNPFIYLLSGQEPYCSKIIKFMTACIAEDSEFYTSTVTDAEFLVKPFSDNDFEKAKQYHYCPR